MKEDVKAVGRAVKKVGKGIGKAWKNRPKYYVKFDKSGGRNGGFANLHLYKR